MTYICINNNAEQSKQSTWWIIHSLEIGKKYYIEIRPEEKLIGWYSVSDCNGWLYNLPTYMIDKYFIPIHKYRKKKLEKLNSL